MSHLFYLLYITAVGYMESLYCHSFIVIDAFPNFAKTPRSDGMLTHLGKSSRNDVGGW